MGEISEGELVEAERAFRKAMLDGDVQTLISLMHPNVTYVAPEGESRGRWADLQKYHLGTFKLDRLDMIEQRFEQYGDTGITFLLAYMKGSLEGESFATTFRYTRTWSCIDGKWQVVASTGFSAFG